MKQKKSAAAAKNQSKPKKIFSAVGKVFLSLFLVMVITGCIVATALTVYVLKFVDPNEDLNLRDLELNYTSIIYAKNPETGEDYEVTRLHGTENRIWVDLEKMPDDLKHAFIAIEDKRFYDHEGVDWKRTFGAFVNLFVHIYDSQAGGSTITQQLVKNITKEDEVSIERKVQESLKRTSTISTSITISTAYRRPPTTILEKTSTSLRSRNARALPQLPKIPPVLTPPESRRTTRNAATWCCAR